MQCMQCTDPGEKFPRVFLRMSILSANAVMETEHFAGETRKTYEKAVIRCRLVIFDVVLKAFSRTQKQHIVTMSAAIVRHQKP